MRRYFVNPFREEGKWFKGNVHAHSTGSDGTRTPEQLVELYTGAGYDFLSITDHGVVTDVEGLGNAGFLLIPGEEMCIGRTHADALYHIVIPSSLAEAVIDLGGAEGGLESLKIGAGNPPRHG